MKVSDKNIDYTIHRVENSIFATCHKFYQPTSRKKRTYQSRYANNYTQALFYINLFHLSRSSPTYVHMNAQPQCVNKHRI